MAIEATVRERYMDDKHPDSEFVDVTSVETTIVQRYWNQYSKSYGFNLYKDIDQYMNECTEDDMVSDIVNTMLKYYEKYEAIDNSEYYDQPASIVQLLKGIKNITVHDDMWGVKQGGYYTTHDIDHFLNGDIVWTIFTEQGGPVDYNNVYIVWTQAIYCNHVGFGHWHCAKLNVEYNEFIEQLPCMMVTLGYRGHYWCSIDGYTFTDNVDDDSDEHNIDVEDMAALLFKHIDADLQDGYNVKVSSDMFGITVMRNPEHVNSNDIMEV